MRGEKHRSSINETPNMTAISGGFGVPKCRIPGFALNFHLHSFGNRWLVVLRPYFSET
jgi:hypothetical protein